MYLPVVDEKARIAKEKRRSRAGGDLGKMKRIGLEARYSASGLEENGEKEEGEEGYALADGERWLECGVVKELPLLWVKRSNLTHGTVMLYNGET